MSAHKSRPETYSWKKGQRRPHIKETVKRELWARAAGRCEFRGCNIRVYADDLTQDRSNLATIAHIVSYSPEGPRGHVTRSALLATDIRNLMLTCKKHGHLIDDQDLVKKYSENLLLEFKHEHEERIRILTKIRQNAQTHVVFVRAPVDGRDHTIDEKEAFHALLPNYPAEEHAADIDLASLGIPASSPGFYEALSSALTEQTRHLLRRRAGQTQIRNLSIFAFAPIPLLVLFGRLIGDIQSVHLYQHHRRNLHAWNWADDEDAVAFYTMSVPQETADHTEASVALVLSVSAPIRPDLVHAQFDLPPLIYELYVPGVVKGRESGRDFLRSRTRLAVFAYEFRRLLDVIRRRHGHQKPVHLFAAVPAPIAIEVGRNVKDVDPPFVVYDYQKQACGYTRALIINNQ